MAWRNRGLARAWLLGVLLVALACSATPKRPAAAAGVVFDQPVGAVKKAAASALVVHGFDIKQEGSSYLQGSRPRKIGFFVGSGGESVGVWLEELGEERTRVTVSTAKSLVGYAAQKSWDTEIYAEIRRELTKSALSTD